MRRRIDTDVSLMGCTYNRLVVTKRGWTQSNEQGDYVAKGEWPRENGSEIKFQMNKCFSFSFKDRQNMTVFFSVRALSHF